ncbi:MAG: metal-dependent hydrolase [Pseudonocardiales bacterium]
MGRSHVASGWCSGALFGYLIGLPPAGVVGFGCVTAGASALNDLDHDDSSASRLLGPVSALLADGVQAYARWVYRVTRGPGDPRRKGAHRGATHSLPLLPLPCVALAVLPWLVSGLARSVAAVAGWDGELVAYWAGPAAVAAVIVFCVLVAADRLGNRVLVGAGFAAVGLSVGQDGVSQDWAAGLVSVAPWVALAVLIGTVTHILGDLVTEAGLYAFAPLYRVQIGTDKERRWVRVALPKWLAFKTNGWFEQGVVFPVLAVCAVLLVPGVWPVAVEVARAVVGY